jgi:hypothetical protein
MKVVSGRMSGEDGLAEPRSTMQVGIFVDMDRIQASECLANLSCWEVVDEVGNRCAGPRAAYGLRGRRG